MKRISSSAPEVVNTASEGLSYVYVFPCVYEDLLKLGFSRDPLARLQSLHPRYYELFDLERGFLIETDTVTEARRLELALRRRLQEHNAPAPLTVRSQAGGRTEWYRGAYAALTSEADTLAGQGSVLHRPAAAWLHKGLLAQRYSLFAQGVALLEGMEGDASALNRPEFEPIRQRVLDTIDGYAALNVPLASCLPEPLMDWYRRRS